MKYLYTTLLISVLACGMQSNLPAAVETEVFTQIAKVTETAQSVNMARIVGSWNFRTSPGESSPLIDTLTDVEVQLIDCKPYAGGMWCEIESGGVTGWINKKGLR